MGRMSIGVVQEQEGVYLLLKRMAALKLWIDRRLRTGRPLRLKQSPHAMVYISTPRKHESQRREKHVSAGR